MKHREIKFKIWNIKKKEWEKFTDAELGATIRGINDDRYILLQYTVLKDKNGIEIYEGDIISSDDCMNMEVIWGDLECAWITNSHRFLGKYSNESKIEVNGNIYENRNLFIHDYKRKSSNLW